MRTLELTLEEAIEICKALGHEHRMQIIRILTDGPQNVNELSEKLGVPFSTAAANIKKLEDAKIISTEIVPGRGSQKVNSNRYDRVVINLTDKTGSEENVFRIEMNIGEFVNCEVEPTCGLLSDTGIIHLLDDPRAFYEQERKLAQLLWFRKGFVEYHFPNRVPFGLRMEELNFSAEICSEAPYYKEDWPSDITCWVNNVEIGTWTSPGDFGGERGFLTPSWWSTNSTQFGLLKNWKINASGCFVDGIKISDVTISDLRIDTRPFISVKIGIKNEAVNKGGLNLFGKKFGNYEQGVILIGKYR
ncbi:ArsR family transcriptional regulator [Bacillus sp. FJAT-27225]|uniref:ArsR/SmtB family transcription factor n=1 Tax=Bacillus sp. FJAT-27225 TaxID=1743144 RepID=UPI00080C34AC|nr:helix-turn-helix domain-containing protein [Bacillus sp. FJAT-27225]OCA87650.1 ArsR family transcriptional regulator [Bacillus sp. FJAT-27225]